MRAFPHTLGALALMSCAAVAHAQTVTEPARLVRLQVAAGQSGLTADDFQITDQGKPQRIALFRDVSQVAPPAAAGPFTNRPAPGTHATVILLDFLEESRPERLDSAHKLGPALKALESGESLFLYVLSPDGSLIPLHEMPKTPAAGDKNWIADAEKLLNGALKSQNKDRPAGMSTEDAVKKTYVALETLANQLSAYPGRRDILWVTSRAPYVMNPQIECRANWWDCSLYVPHLVVTLERAGVMIDPFSYIGLGVDESRTIEEMAGLTGGQSFLSQDLPAALKQFGQSAGTYEIAFAPPADSWDSKFHRLKVTSEKKGVKIQTRQHYYAVPDQRAIGVRQQAMMVAAYQSSSDVADIGLRAAIAPAGKPNAVRIDIRIDPASLLLHSDGGQLTGGLTVLLSARAAAGPQGEPTLSDEPLHLTPQQRDAAMKDGLAVTREYAIDNATEKVRLIILDRSGDSIGSLTIPVKH